jgi:hypothetical protein
MLGRYGFFEAIDFTQRRLEVGQRHNIVHSYMAHHQGMSIVALANVLLPEYGFTVEQVMARARRLVSNIQARL